MEGFYLNHCRFKDIIIKKIRIIWIFLVSIRYKRTNIRFQFNEQYQFLFLPIKNIRVLNCLTDTNDQKTY